MPLLPEDARSSRRPPDPLELLGGRVSTLGAVRALTGLPARTGRGHSTPKDCSDSRQALVRYKGLRRMAAHVTGRYASCTRLR